MDKAKPLEVLTLSFWRRCRICLCDNRWYSILVQTTFKNRNYQGPRIWFNSFSDIVIPPNQTRDFYVEGECFGHPQEIPLLNGLF